LRKLAARIQLAKANAWATGAYTSTPTFARWNKERTARLSEVNAIDDQLRKLRLSEAAKIEKIGPTFEAVFLQTARQMLADDVFERVQLAAYHRLADAVRAA
jgi:hypothetical protein